MGTFFSKEEITKDHNYIINIMPEKTKENSDKENLLLSKKYKINENNYMDIV